MAERLFAIGELSDKESPSCLVVYEIKSEKVVGYLRPDAVIPASRLRYGCPKPGDRSFAVIHGGFWEWSTPCDKQVLILDPPAPADPWEQWVEEMPGFTMSIAQKDATKAWLKRCPGASK